MKAKITAITATPTNTVITSPGTIQRPRPSGRDKKETRRGSPDSDSVPRAELDHFGNPHDGHKQPKLPDRIGEFTIHLTVSPFPDGSARGPKEKARRHWGAPTGKSTTWVCSTAQTEPIGRLSLICARLFTGACAGWRIAFTTAQASRTAGL